MQICDVRLLLLQLDTKHEKLEDWFSIWIWITYKLHKLFLKPNQFEWTHIHFKTTAETNDE